MKLIDLLARELTTWPDSAIANYCVPDRHGEVFFGGGVTLQLSQVPEDHERGRVTPGAWEAARWNGKDGGLPPVGIECEQAPRGVAEHAREILWRKVRIIAHLEDSRFTGPVAVYLPTDGQANCDQAVAGCFRPIRTAEQIAAEEQKILQVNACAEIEPKLEGYNVDIDCSAAIRMTINAMIEAGYRKVQP